MSDPTPTDTSDARFNVNGMVIDFLATDPDVTMGRQSGMRRPHQGLTRPWMSEVGRCHRQVGFRLANAPVTNPPHPNDSMNWYVGLIVQAIVQQAAEWHFGRDRFMAERPVRVPLLQDVKQDGYMAPIIHESQEMMLSGRVDGVLVEHEPYSDLLKVTEVWEVKKVAQYGWLLITGQKGSKEGPGPRKDDLWQANLGGYALGAAKTRMIYAVTDATQGQQRLADYAQPVDAAQASRDILRMSEVWEEVHIRNTLPEAYWPTEDKVIEFPLHGRNKWPCGYCSYRDLCADVQPRAGDASAIPLPKFTDDAEAKSE